MIRDELIRHLKVEAECHLDNPVVEHWLREAIKFLETNDFEPRDEAPIRWPIR